MRTTLILPCYNHSPYQPQFSFQNTNLMSYPSRKSVASDFHTSCTSTSCTSTLPPFCSCSSFFLLLAKILLISWSPAQESSHWRRVTLAFQSPWKIAASSSLWVVLHFVYYMIRCLSFLPDKDFPKGILYLNHWQRVHTQNMLKKSMVEPSTNKVNALINYNILSTIKLQGEII